MANIQKIENKVEIAPRNYKLNFSDFVGIGKNGNLWVEDCDVEELVKKYGSPLLIISESQFRQSFRQFKKAFTDNYKGEVEILYANKSNNSLALRHIMNQEGGGGDCFGVNEMYISLLAGTNPKMLVLNGSNKQDEELEMAIANGLCINIDSMDELGRIFEISKKFNKSVDIGIRLALDLDPLAEKTGVSMHGPGTLKEQSDSTKWGMTREQTVEIVNNAQKLKNIHLKETHFHLSRMTNEVEPFAVMAREMITWSHYINENSGWTPPCIDIGGGWTYGRWYGTGPNSQIDDENAPKYSDYGKRISEVITEEAEKYNLPLPKLRIEPGRLISGPCGVAVGAVGAVKEGEKKKWVNLDLSTNHLSWAAILDWYYHAVPVENAEREATETVDIVGPLCNSDEIGKHRKMPPLIRGEHVAFLDAGGYVESQAARYNAQCLPATVLVFNELSEITTEREQLRDVSGRFRVPPRLLAQSFS